MNSQEQILLRLKESGHQTAQQLAQFLGMSTMGARKHLVKLREQTLVEDFSRAEKAGRPAQYWTLTDAGHARFPDRHSALSVQLINSIQEVFGSEGLDRLIQQREQEQRISYQAGIDALPDLQQRVAALAKLRSDEGYMAVFEADNEHSNVYWLHENHCPICDAAKHCMQFCRSELALFQSLLGDDVQVSREHHLLSGARRCSYRIEQQNP